MPIITAFKPQRNNKRVNIYIDGEFSFGLDLENFVKLGLKLNQELTNIEIEEIVKKAEFQKTFDKLLRFVIVRPRSEKEIKDYLKRKKVHESLNEELFNRLNRLELINDTKFSKWWVDQRLAFKNKSKKDLKFELRAKGIKNEIIENTLEENEIDEVKIAKKLIEKKEYKWDKYEEKIKKQKIIQYLSGKGFGWDVISKIVGTIANDE
ncbi:MAG: RecX family transcriptional regulator [Candidatus Woesebacteria bacterium]|nr:RecX family transcriptional regulator [Candidatus Woesebacteria bacterium]